MDFHDRYQGGFLLPRVIKCATENFVTEEKAKEMEVGIYRSCYFFEYLVIKSPLTLKELADILFYVKRPPID